jgi:hypothetical protein
LPKYIKTICGGDVAISIVVPCNICTEPKEYRKKCKKLRYNEVYPTKKVVRLSCRSAELNRKEIEITEEDYLLERL